MPNIAQPTRVLNTAHVTCWSCSVHPWQILKLSKIYIDSEKVEPRVRQADHFSAEWSHGIVDYKPLLRQCRLYGKTIQIRLKSNSRFSRDALFFYSLRFIKTKDLHVAFKKTPTLGEYP